MTGLISRPPTPDSDPPTSVEPEVITGDGWWPDVDTAALRPIARLPSDITPARLREAVRNAMICIGDELAEWRAPLELAGAETLEGVEAPTIDGRSKLYWLYDRAISALVAADLQERYADIGATRVGLDRAEELAAATFEHRRNYRWAIADIQGKPRAVVELI